MSEQEWESVPDSKSPNSTPEGTRERYLKAERIFYSYSKFNRAKQCHLKFFDAHVKKGETTNLPTDNKHAYIGTMVQHIFESVLTHKKTLGPALNRNTKPEDFDKSFKELTDKIDKDLKLLWKFIQPLDSFETDYDTQELFPLEITSRDKDDSVLEKDDKVEEKATILSTSTLCSVDASKYSNKYQMANSIIKAIRERYKEALHSMFHLFNLEDLQCEVPRTVEIWLDEPGYENYVVVLKAKVDFIWTAGSNQRYQGEKLILDGKSSEDSYMDALQLKIYTILEAGQTGDTLRGDWKTNRVQSAFWAYKQDKFIPSRPYNFSEEERVEIIKDMIDTHKKLSKFEKEEDYNPSPEFFACRFCDRANNCWANNTAVADISEI